MNTNWRRTPMVKHKLDAVSCGLAGGDLEQYHTKGYLAFRPCSLVTGQLDAAARFTLHLAGKVARSLKPMPKLGDGYHFPELGITRSRIQDGFMNADFARTRHSITTHYLLEGFEKVWNPLGSVGASKLVASAAVVIPHTQTPLVKPLTASDGKVPERILAAHWRT